MKYALLCLIVLLLAGCSQPKEPAAAPKAENAPEFYKVDATTAGTLSGSVRFTGKKPPAKPISMDSEEACEKLHDKPVDGSGIAIGKDGGLAGVFVYIKTGLEGKAFEPPTEAVVLDQRGCMFVPRVVALRAGQTLKVKNSDPVSHNIHPNPRNNREWNQQQAPGAPELSRRFAQPEVMIPVRCNVHSWMRSYVGVMNHPYFAVTNDAGTFEWGSVPPGDYTIAAWHESFGELTQNITLAKSGTAAANFTFPAAKK